ncbi:hypothetical protein C8A05DRAFT_30900 [Staphylotrichum tortipilum]|uniref:Uncharacterized protein n=1 Tax=Staphylotrichum tortipilum TaxID=2831512 RepID=A0AAN6MRU2_9PEZI|nr:hypothetical protein C8A05DRAFT_30900 [Staphylotrichum longicolle]
MSDKAWEMHEALNHGKLDKWGWVIYRTSYKDDAAWDRFQRYVYTWWQQELVAQGAPPLVANTAEWTFVSNPALDSISRDELRTHFRRWRATAIQTENPRRRLPTSGDDIPGRYIYFFQADEAVLDGIAVQGSTSTPGRDPSMVNFVCCDDNIPLGQPPAPDDQRDQSWTMLSKRIVSIEFWLEVGLSIEHWDICPSIYDVMETEELETERERASERGRLFEWECEKAREREREEERVRERVREMEKEREREREREREWERVREIEREKEREIERERVKEKASKLPTDP